MKRPRFLRARWLVPGFLLLPLVVWALLLVIVPTDWARNRLVAALSEATGRPVRLGAIHLGPFGRVRLSGLAVEAPSAVGDPWLQVASVTTDLNLAQVLAGCMKPTEVQVSGLTLRILRRKDGTLELRDLLERPRSAKGFDPNQGDDSGPTVAVRLTDARIVVVDEPSGTKLEFDGVEGAATWTKARVRISELHGTLNGGTFELAAEVDRDEHAPAFEGQVRARDVAMADGMNALAYLVPVLAGTAGVLDGRMDLDVYLTGKGTAADDLTPSLTGKGSVKLDPVRLDGSKLVADLGKIVEIPASGRVGAVKTDFTIKDGRITTDDLTVLVGRSPVVLSGWTGFDGTLDYRIKTEHLVEKLPGKARDFLAEMQIDLKEVAIVRVQGTLDRMVVTLDGGGLTTAPGGGADQGERRLDDPQRLRDLTRRLKDRFLR